MRRGAWKAKGWGLGWGSERRSAGGCGPGPAREERRRRPLVRPEDQGSCPFSTGAGLARGGRLGRNPREADSAGGRGLLGHRLPDAGEAAPCAAAAAPPQRGGERSSPSSSRG